MNRILSAIAPGIAAALALAACGAPRAVLMPVPPSEVRREAAAPPPAARTAEPPVSPGAAPAAREFPRPGDAARSPVGETAPAPAAAPPPPDRLPQYTEACDLTARAIARGAPIDAVRLWRALEDSKWGRDAVYNQGVLFQLAGDLDAAAKRYAQAAEESPAFEPPVANLLGISLLRGDRPRMKALLARIVPPGSAPPPDMLPELAVNAAAALMETGRKDDASRLLHSLRSRGKATPALPWNLAVLSFRKGDPATARDVAGTVSPGVANLFPVAASRYAWAKEGERIPEVGPVPPGMAGIAALSANIAAYVEHRNGNPAAAEKALAFATAVESVPAEILTNIGIQQAELGRWRDARSSLEQAVREDPGLAAGWLNLGIFREIYQGDVPGALECYNNYVKLGGSRKQEVGRWSERLGQSSSPRQ